LVKKFRFKLAHASEIGFVAFAQVLASKRFHLARSILSGLYFGCSNQVSKIGYAFLAKDSTSLGQAFLPGSFFLAK